MATNLPPVNADLKDDLQERLQQSVTCIIQVAGYKKPCLGWYFHGMKEWKGQCEMGAVKVLEWWPLPVVGTGIKVEE